MILNVPDLYREIKPSHNPFWNYGPLKTLNKTKLTKPSKIASLVIFRDFEKEKWPIIAEFGGEFEKTKNFTNVSLIML